MVTVFGKKIDFAFLFQGSAIVDNFFLVRGKGLWRERIIGKIIFFPAEAISDVTIWRHVWFVTQPDFTNMPTDFFQISFCVCNMPNSQLKMTYSHRLILSFEGDTKHLHFLRKSDALFKPFFH
jgi:hypothetical protein